MLRFNGQPTSDKGKEARDSGLTSIPSGLDAAVFILAVLALDAVDDQTGQIAVQLFLEGSRLCRVEVAL